MVDKIYTLDEIMPHVLNGRMTLDGEIIKTGRFLVFFKKGTKCVACGLKASFFRKDKETNNTTILNLYGVGLNNRAVKFTRDHIVPASRGGTLQLSNIQPMCQNCNSNKADYISFPNQVKESVKVIKSFVQGIKARMFRSIGLLRAIWR